MKRREFIGLFSTTVLAWPPIARAQQAATPIVAYLGVGSPDAVAGRINAFRKGLGETGYTEDRNVQVEYHWLDGQYQHLAAVLDDLIRRHVAVMAIPGTTPISLAAKSATNTIPIVFGVAEDPVKLGLVTSLARPGGNATGINFFAIEAETKRFGLMHDLLPNAARFAVLINPSNPRYSEVTSKSLSEAARTLGLDIVFYKASTPGEIDAAFAAMARDRADALFIGGEALFLSRGVQIATLAIRDRLPASFPARELVQAGLLMSYGADLIDMARQVGIYTGSILKGAKPADLPVLQSTRFEFVINLQTARSLNLDIPPMLLARADEVIE
jgi:putative tryptophan/tyrosine transport system substrate-binding protein